MRLTILLLLISEITFGQSFRKDEIDRWKSEAASVTITRDNWGIPHIHGKSDADAVFGMLYAQCEDDFERVERNYLTATARMAEAEGEGFIYHDLRMRLFIDTTQAIALFKTAPDWMKKVCTAFADGINFYLYTHPEVKPKLIRRFQPWMPLLFSEGSIGGDIESVSLNRLKEFYTKEPGVITKDGHEGGDGLEPEPRGSNGFAIAPSKSASGNSMLLINPHTSFYFRSELQVTSDEGLNAYGAVTWGQFFIYQGFNEHCGWMHTSSQADVIDEYKETVSGKPGTYVYKHGSASKAVTEKKITIYYKTQTGLQKKEFTGFSTHHGPVIAEQNGKWISVHMMQEPVKALTQSYQRTKAKSFQEFRKVMELYTNSSNNTVYADDQKNIAYWHGDFMPRRDTRFDWSKPLDGSDPATDWKGLHTLDEIVHIVNPPGGWIQNCNSTPFTAAGKDSPVKGAYPDYMAPDAENARGLHAVKLLNEENSLSLERLITVAYDSYLPGFENLVPAFVQAFEEEAAGNDTLRSKYAEPMESIRKWNMRFSQTSIPTTIAMYWAKRLQMDVMSRIPAGTSQLGIINYMQIQTTSKEKMKALAGAVAELQRDFGKWQLPWGEVNRFQRLTGKIESVFDDGKPSLPVAFTSSFWGSLAAFGARKYPGTKKMYGYVGNSFVAAVEFGKKVRAKSIVTGGSSSDPASPHFNDQSAMYTEGQFKDILFYKDDLAKHTEKSYKPGDR